MDRIYPGDVCAGAVKRRMTERDDAGEAKHEIKRQSEQYRDQDLAREGKLIAEHEISTNSGGPPKCFDRSEAMLAQRGDDGIGHGSGSPEQTGGTPDQQPDHHNVDEESAELRDEIFARGVTDAEQQRGDEGAADGTETAYRNDHQEVNQILDRVAWIDRQYVGTEAAAQSGEAGPQGEGHGEQRRGVDAYRPGHAPVVDRGAQAGA